jgi:hypothetical protein
LGNNGSKRTCTDGTSRQTFVGPKVVQYIEWRRLFNRRPISDLQIREYYNVLSTYAEYIPKQ